MLHCCTAAQSVDKDVSRALSRVTHVRLLLYSHNTVINITITMIITMIIITEMIITMILPTTTITIIIQTHLMLHS